MAKPTHTLTGPASGLGKALGKSTETVAVYGKADLNARLAAAKSAGVNVQVTKK